MSNVKAGAAPGSREIIVSSAATAFIKRAGENTYNLLSVLYFRYLK